jgi:hypothetical protein
VAGSIPSVTGDADSVVAGDGVGLDRVQHVSHEGLYLVVRGAGCGLGGDQDEGELVQPRLAGHDVDERVVHGGGNVQPVQLGGKPGIELFGASAINGRECADYPVAAGSHHKIDAGNKKHRRRDQRQHAEVPRGLEGGAACTIALLVSTIFIWRTGLLSATPELKQFTSEENPTRVKVRQSLGLSDTPPPPPLFN